MRTWLKTNMHTHFESEQKNSRKLRIIYSSCEQKRIFCLPLGGLEIPSFGLDCRNCTLFQGNGNLHGNLGKTKQAHTPSKVCEMYTEENIFI